MVSKMIEEFHQAFGDQPHELGFPDWSIRRLRMDLLREEVIEYMDAEEDEDLVEIADALADMVYVIYGTAYSYGIPLDAILSEVHRSNMTKDFSDGSGKIKKGPGFERPNLLGILSAELDK